jgi:hypothetical protein
MLNRVTAILFLLALTSTYFSRLFILADFELNRQYIADHYCINKNRPWMHCNGHCYLMRKLNEAREKQDKDQEQVQKSFSLEAVFHVLPSIVLPGRSLAAIFPGPGATALFPIFLTPPFQPPRLA